jgi:predicted MFS family arabinose efflux permease
MGLVFIPSISITAAYFQTRRALAVGIVTSGAAIGGILYPIIFEALLARIDFRWVVRVIALVALVTLAVSCLLIRQRTDLPKKKKAPMLELGAFKERAYLVLVIGMFASFSGLYMVYFYVENRAKAAHVDLKGLKPYYLVSFLNVGGVFGRIIPNHLADKYIQDQCHAMF